MFKLIAAVIRRRLLKRRFAKLVSSVGVEKFETALVKIGYERQSSIDSRGRDCTVYTKGDSKFTITEK